MTAVSDWLKFFALAGWRDYTEDVSQPWIAFSLGGEESKETTGRGRHSGFGRRSRHRPVAGVHAGLGGACAGRRSAHRPVLGRRAVVVGRDKVGPGFGSVDSWPRRLHGLRGD